MPSLSSASRREEKEITREDMLFFLRYQIAFLQRLPTRAERAGVAFDIFAYLDFHFASLKAFFGNTKLIRTIYRKCQQMIDEQMERKDFPTLLTISLRLREKVSAILPADG